MAAHEQFFEILFDIIGLTVTDFSPESLAVNFFLPLGAMIYATYLLFEKIRIFRHAQFLNAVLALITGLFAVRFLGSFAFWVGMFGIFLLRLRGTFTKFVGLLIVFLIYSQLGSLFSNNFLSATATVIALIAILFVLDRRPNWAERIIWIALIVAGYWYLSPLLVGKIPELSTGIWIFAIFGSLIALSKSPNLLWGFIITLILIGSAFFLTQNLPTITAKITG
jgi:hypothetical protein